MNTGQQRKLVGMKRASRKNKAFTERCRTFAIQHAQHFGRVTASDVRRWAQEHGLKPTSPAGWGPVFQCKKLRRVGYESSTIDSRHRGVSSVWEYVP